MTYSQTVLKKLEIHKPFSIVELHWIGTSLNTCSFQDLLDDMSHDDLTTFFGGDWSFLEEEEWTPRELNILYSEKLQELGKLGFLAEVHFPIPTKFKNELTNAAYSWTHSFGCCRRSIFYAETCDELTAKICKEADEFFAEEFRKQKEAT